MIELQEKVKVNVWSSLCFFLLIVTFTCERGALSSSGSLACSCNNGFFLLLRTNICLGSSNTPELCKDSSCMDILLVLFLVRKVVWMGMDNMFCEFVY